ncbi:MAG: glutaredoxin domain-containing protein [Methylovulum sp.]|uniref:glutaredoxin family protein n=1 Tax=Methylovulum sp. TaxID=1916980 RepID=UPI002634A69C|nr:glutaredoxin domain-containing protein [Methylovulum sp.]MDD2724683.1 glutaredoxin domain-containing protein [Methylovulum sp.]MDD5124988.1 glutaredoxin domain-containing protein [Methylovulum sp.]
MLASTKNLQIPPLIRYRVETGIRQSLFTLSFWLLLALLLNFPGAVTADDLKSSQNIQQTVAIEVFVRDGCLHCAKAEEFLQLLQREQPKLQISIRDIQKDPSALERLKAIASTQNVGTAKVPAFYLNKHLVIGYSDEATTGKLLRAELAQQPSATKQSTDTSGSCEAAESLSCTAENAVAQAKTTDFDVTLLGQRISLEQVGLPLFTVAMGLLDGFNPCSMWVLVLMISLLAPMQDRTRMLAVAGAFIAVEGIAYFVFMAAWLNLFLLIGLSRASEIIIAGIAILAGAINLKDFWAFGWGVSLSIPKSAKPGVYARIRGILQAENLPAAMLGAVILAILVQIVEFLCTSGFPALFTRILTMRQTTGMGYYAYLLLYNVAYMLDDIIVLSIGVITLSQRRLQEKEGRWLKLLSGLVMVGLGLYLLMGQ